MSDAALVSLYRRHRFPSEIIGHAVWLYFRFSLSHRDVEELLAERGIRVTYEAIRLWCHKFGPTYASQLHRRRPGPSDKWHIDDREMAAKRFGRLLASKRTCRPAPITSAKNAQTDDAATGAPIAI